ncbi:MAG: GMP/IMP nucleotidase [Deltaproteobacteria bacterium]|nr:GMP/IMP nucleotidase [Deltaproteobacteria bacterium]
MHLPWDKIDTVLLDMDGTLLDLHFDNYFWLEYVPAVYADGNGISRDEATEELLKRYKREEGTLNWTDLDFWSRELDLDIPTLKTEVDHLIQVHPHVESFLKFLQKSEKKIYLVTNAHSKTLDLKMKKTRLSPCFHGIISAHDLGIPKEKARFWEVLDERIGYNPERTLLAEDSEANLRSAQTAGIGHLIFVAKPSTKDPPQSSADFPSIRYFNELLPS